MIQQTWNLPGTLEDVMRSMTHREYLTRLAWLDEQWNNPDRSDFYLMQIAQEVRRVLSKKPNRIELKHFKLKFQSLLGKPEQVDEQQKLQESKRNWFGALGIKKDPNK